MWNIGGDRYAIWPPLEQMKPIQVVLETSVLVAAVRSSQGASFRILQLVGDPRWELNLSPALLFEYEESRDHSRKKVLVGTWTFQRLAGLSDYEFESSDDFLFVATDFARRR